MRIIFSLLLIVTFLSAGIPCYADVIKIMKPGQPTTICSDDSGTIICAP